MSDTVQMREIKIKENDFVDSYEIAEQIVTQAIDSHGYWEVIKVCQKHIQGEKPLNPDELKAKGLGWVANWNFGKARAKIEKGTAESTSKISSALAMGYVTFRSQEEEDDGILSFLKEDNQRGVVASVLGVVMAQVLAKENRLSGFLNDVEYPAFAYGYAALQHDSLDWMPDVIHPLNIAFQPNSKPNNIEQWVTFNTVKAKELYRRWVKAKNESFRHFEKNGVEMDIANSGWSITGLEDILTKLYQGTDQSTQKPYETWAPIMARFEQNSSMVIANTADVQVAKIHTKELDGTFSEVYIPYANPWQKENRGGAQVLTDFWKTNHILFKKNHGKYNQSDYLHIIRDSGFSETGYIQDYRGIAKYAVEDSIRYNRTRNSLLNKNTFAGLPMFEASNTQENTKLKLTVAAGYCILPATHRLVEKQPSFDMATHIAVLNFEEGQYVRDTQQYDASVQGRLSSRPNRGEVEQVTREVEFTGNAKNNIKFRDYSAAFQSIIKRMAVINPKDGDPGYEGKKRFFNLCKEYLAWMNPEPLTDDDIKEILKAIDSYIIEPVVTNTQIITMALQMAETPFARNRLKRMLLIAQGLPIEEVNMSVPLISDKFASMQDERMATFENDMFFTTSEILLAPTDDHIIHLDVHLSKNDRVLQGFQEQRIGAKEAATFLTNSIPHAIRHVELLGEDPNLNGKAKEYFERLKEQNKAKDQLTMMAQQQAQAETEAAQQPQIDPKTANEIANTNAKVLADTARKDWLAENRTAQREQEIQNKHEQRMAELNLKFSQPS